MPDRSVPPPIREINELRFPPPERISLDNGIPVFVTNLGTQEIVKLEVAYHAGRPFEHQQLVARSTLSQLKEGTNSFSSAEVAEKLDYYGGSLSQPVNLDLSSSVLFCLRKHFDALLPIFREVVLEPTFPEAELLAFRERQQQRLQIDLSQNEVLAYRLITELIYGDRHPYGYNSSKEIYEQLERNDLRRHFDEWYLTNNCQIFLSGRIDDRILRDLNHSFGQHRKERNWSVPKLSTTTEGPRQLYVERPESVQTAIRIGRRTFTRHHPDYVGMSVLNTILGGYFSSRLMNNIREEKGYTYGIFSTLDAMHYDGCFYVGTEVGNEYVQATITEIYREMEVLCEELVGPDELSMVKNYMIGNLLPLVDGPFNISELIKSQIMGGLPDTYLSDFVKGIRSISPTTLRDLARTYLRREDMWQVVVGIM